MAQKYVSPIADFAGKVFTKEELEIRSLDTTVVGGVQINLKSPPQGLINHEDLGLLIHESVGARLLHAWPEPYSFTEPVRACITPGGDYLAICPAGLSHQWGKTHKVNELVAYRSHDRGHTWSEPSLPWEVPYPQHGFNPIIPRGGKRIYTFGADYHPDYIKLPHTGAIGLRYSDDDGHTWSELSRIEPVNDPGIRGVAHMQGCETDAGTWLLGTYTIDTGGPKGRIDHQYVLRSEDQGRTWELLPGKRPGGWMWKEAQRMLEGRVINLGGGEALMHTRTMEGHIWELRSFDDGQTWTEPVPTSLIHPDAPPMLFHLTDGETLIAFIHNKPGGSVQARDELWFSISGDHGHTWSKPRFILASACVPAGKPRKPNMEVSYADLIADNGNLQLFFDHAKRRIVHARFTESDLEGFPTREDLAL